MIIDFHTHCFPDALAKKATAQLSKVAGNAPFYTDGTVGGLKKSMRECGIDLSVIQHIATKPAQTPIVNRWAADINDEQTVCFGTIHPEYVGWKDEISFLQDANIKGVKFHPDYQGFTVDEKRLYPIYEGIAKAGLIMLFHAGLDIGLPGPYKCMPENLNRVLKDFPGAKVIAAHMGGYAYWDLVEKHLLGEELYLDTSYCLIGMSDQRLKGLILSHGYKKVLFGSDSPWTNQKAEAEKIRGLGLDEAKTDAVLAGNAKRLLNI